jgi:uncharacterized protein YoxC
MPTYVTREEFEARMTVVEREVEGEEMVTRHILEQTRRNGDDLAALKTRIDRVEKKVDGLEQKVDGLGRKVDLIDGKLDGLTKSLPTIVAETMREVLDERDRKAR